jgi:hypothetical protein
LWHNRQTEARLVLRPKLRNHHGDFVAQITKPELPVLMPKLGNRTTLVLRLNQETCRGDFEAQITKLELSVLRPKLGNRRPWF